MSSGTPADRHRRVKEIFLRALDAPEDERAALVGEACGDDAALRAEVESLLASHVPESAAEFATEPTARTGVATSLPRFEAGAVLAERYRIVARIGRGGMGDVYRADDLVLGQSVALKFLPQGLATSPAALAAVLHEVRIARDVTHPNVCRVHDVIRIDGEHVISMEYVDGEDLRALLRRIGRLPADKAAEIARQLCAGLAAAHARGVLHRDLKPANVLVDGRGRVRITDFGIAGRDGGPESDGAGALVAGTPEYMAPELTARTGRAAASVASDLYALGLVLYETFTGHPAFEAATPGDLLRRHREDTPSSPAAFVRDLDPAVERIVLQCLEKDARLRPASAMAVAAALPGGDALAAALAAGETPSPELIAAADGGAALDARVSRHILAMTLVLLVAAAGLVPLLLPGDRDGIERSPRVLAERARAFLADVGWTVPPVDTAFGFSTAPPERTLTGPDGDQHVVDLGVAEERRFWYREFDEPLVPEDVLTPFPDVGRVTPYDPSDQVVGTALVHLDDAGRLLMYSVYPYVDDEGEAEPPDWMPFLEAADVDVDTLELDPVTGLHDPIWNARRTDGADVHIHGSSLGGVVTDVEVVLRSSIESQGDEPIEDMTRADAWWLGGTFELLLVFGLLAVAAVPAWLHATGGRGDRRGAARIAALACGVGVLMWLLTAHHAGALAEQLPLVRLALAGVLFRAAVVWVFYMAMEPYVRRFWPRSVVSWSRLLAGRWGDSLVGRDVLVGVATGTFAVLVAGAVATLVHDAGWGEGVAFLATLENDTLLGLRHWLAVLLRAGLSALYSGLAFLLALCLLRAVFRRIWIGGVVVALGFGALAMLLGDTLPTSWLPIGLLAVAGGTALLLRSGFVALVTAIFTARLLLAFPITLALGRRYADAGLFALVVCATLALLGQRAAVRRG